MKLTWEILNRYVAEGKIMSNKHPEKDLWILNYSRLTQFEKHWDSVTLACRGLVVDENCNIIASPLPKFFNRFEYAPDVVPVDLPYEVFEKMDGSLGIGFEYQGEFIIASRGSFTSDQAVKAKEIYDRVVAVTGNDYFQIKYTFCFEIIYPQNRIVVDYGDAEKLVVLAEFHTETGKELAYNDTKYWFDLYKMGQTPHMDLVKRLEFDCSLDELKTKIPDNAEGFIIRFHNGFKMKDKSEEYCRLHRILTNVSNKSIWEAMMNGDTLEVILQNVPDEFDEKVRLYMNELTTQFNTREELHHEVVINLIHLDKKEFVEAVMTFCKEEDGYDFGVVMSMYNGNKKWPKLIWNSIQPIYSKNF